MARSEQQTTREPVAEVGSTEQSPRGRRFLGMRLFARKTQSTRKWTERSRASAKAVSSDGQAPARNPGDRYLADDCVQRLCHQPLRAVLTIRYLWLAPRTMKLPFGPAVGPARWHHASSSAPAWVNFTRVPLSCSTNQPSGIVRSSPALYSAGVPWRDARLVYALGLKTHPSDRMQARNTDIPSAQSADVGIISIRSPPTRQQSPACLGA